MWYILSLDFIPLNTQPKFKGSETVFDRGLSRMRELSSTVLREKKRSNAFHLLDFFGRWRKMPKICYSFYRCH
jgi:hypothetical protein